MPNLRSEGRNNLAEQGIKLETLKTLFIFFRRIVLLER